jgi:signal transduction histidine kinase
MLSPRLVDIGVAAGVAALAMTTIDVASEQDARSPDALAFALGAAMGAVLLARRRWPFGVLVATGLLLLLYHVLGYPGLPLALLLAAALYTATVSGRLRATIVFCAVAVFGSIGVRAILEGESLLRLVGSDAIREASMMAAVVLLGDAVRSRRALAAEMRDRLRRAREEQQREASRRVVEERLRITRELHDVTSHTIAVIAVQAGVAQDVLDDLDAYPDAARSALATIRGASKQAMSELRATVGVLRDDPAGAPLRPPPGLAQVRELLDQTAGSGLRVELRVDGDARDLPAVVDLTAFRIVQEALTNVLRHAAATSVTVRVRHEPDSVVVEVTDDGRGRGPDGGPVGYGLAGMAERAAVLGGRVDAGPLPDGGFKVHAWLPLPAAATAGATGAQP